MVYHCVGLLGLLVAASDIFCFDYMHHLGCMSMLCRVEYVHDSIVLSHICGYVHTIGVASPTPFTGVGGGCVAGG